MALSGQKTRAMDMLEIVSFSRRRCRSVSLSLTQLSSLLPPHRSSALPDTPWRPSRSMPTRSFSSSNSLRSARCAPSSPLLSPLANLSLFPSQLATHAQIQPLPKYTTPAVVTACKAHAGAYLDYAHAYASQDKAGLTSLLDKHREVFEKVRAPFSSSFTRGLS